MVLGLKACNITARELTKLEVSVSFLEESLAAFLVCMEAGCVRVCACVCEICDTRSHMITNSLMY